MNANSQPGTKCAVVLDIDNTLTPPRRPLEADMAQTLRKLKIPFFLGAGGDLRLIAEQFIEPLHSFGYRGSFDAFLCNGSVRYRVDIAHTSSVTLLFDFKLRDHLGPDRFDKLIKVIDDTLNLNEFQVPLPMRVIGERIVDRVSMINVAPIGRPTVRLSHDTLENRDMFREFDEATGFRRRFLNHLTDKLSDFSPLGLCITLGGETSFDIVIRGHDKSFPLQTLLNEGFDRIWYIGDALFEGGNDEAVLDFIKAWLGPSECPVSAIRVGNWRETPAALKNVSAVAARLGNQLAK